MENLKDRVFPLIVLILAFLIQHRGPLEEQPRANEPQRTLTQRKLPHNVSPFPELTPSLSGLICSNEGLWPHDY